jgi:hypothetical protein
MAKKMTDTEMAQYLLKRPIIGPSHALFVQAVKAGQDPERMLGWEPDLKARLEDEIAFDQKQKAHEDLQALQAEGQGLVSKLGEFADRLAKVKRETEEKGKNE